MLESPLLRQRLVEDIKKLQTPVCYTPGCRCTPYPESSAAPLLNSSSIRHLPSAAAASSSGPGLSFSTAASSGGGAGGFVAVRGLDEDGLVGAAASGGVGAVAGGTGAGAGELVGGARAHAGNGRVAGGEGGVDGRGESEEENDSHSGDDGAGVAEEGSDGEGEEDQDSANDPFYIPDWANFTQAPERVLAVCIRPPPFLSSSAFPCHLPFSD